MELVLWSKAFGGPPLWGQNEVKSVRANDHELEMWRQTGCEPAALVCLCPLVQEKSEREPSAEKHLAAVRTKRDVVPEVDARRLLI